MAEIYGFLLVIFIGGMACFYFLGQKLDEAVEQRRYIIKRLDHLEKEWSWLRGRLPLSAEDQAMIGKIIEGHKKEQSVEAITGGLGSDT